MGTGLSTGLRRSAKAPNTNVIQLARLAYLTGRYEDVLSLEPRLREPSFWADRIRRSPAWEVVACFSLHALGRHQEELARAKSMRKDFPEWGLLGLNAEILAQAGLRNADAVKALVAEAQALRPRTPSPWVSLGRARAAAVELLAHGSAEAARSILGDAIREEEGRLAAEDSSVARLESLAELFEAADRFAEMRRASEAMLRRAPLSEGTWRRSGLGYLGLAAAATGDTATARQVLAELEQSPNGAMTALSAPWQAAAILAVLGDTLGAVAKMREARAAGDLLAWAHVNWHRSPSLFPLLELPAVRQVLGAR